LSAPRGSLSKCSERIFLYTDAWMVRCTKERTGDEIPKESTTMADLFKENLWLVPALGATFLVVLAILTL
jgi:hypothetical protein